MWLRGCERDEASGGGTVWSVTQVMRAPLPELEVPGGYAIARSSCAVETGLVIGQRVTVSLSEGRWQGRHDVRSSEEGSVHDRRPRMMALKEDQPRQQVPRAAHYAINTRYE